MAIVSWLNKYKKGNFLEWAESDDEILDLFEETRRASGDGEWALLTLWLLVTVISSYSYLSSSYRKHVMIYKIKWKA